MHRWILVLACSLLVLVSSAGCRRADEAVELAGPGDAVRHPDAKRLRFQGRAILEHAGVAVIQPASASRNAAPGAPRHRFVIPVVPEGWTKDAPVPLWISPATDLDANDPSTLAPSMAKVAASPVEGPVLDHAGRAPGFREESAVQAAVKDAEARHGIRSDPAAPIVAWPPKGG